MPITIKIGDSAKEEKKPIQASITLQVKKTLDGNLLINDHKYLDIIISPAEGKVVTMPKPNVEKDVYDYQKDLMYDLYKGGVTAAAAPRGGAVFGMVETTYPTEGDVDTLQAVLYRISEYLKHVADAEQVAEEYDENIEVYVTSDFKVTLVREVRSEFISNYDEDGSLDSQENIIVLKGLVL